MPRPCGEWEANPELRTRTWGGLAGPGRGYGRGRAAVHSPPTRSRSPRSRTVGHLYSIRGTWWAEWLARTGRDGPGPGADRAATSRSARRHGWNEDLARCDRILGRLALAAGDTAAAGEHLAAAAAVFRDGDSLTELAATLADLAEHARVSGDLDGADRHATEAITIAAPRGLVPAQARRAGRPRPYPRRPRPPPVTRTRCTPGPGRRRRRAAARRPAPAGLARTGRAARPRRRSTRPKGSTRAGPPRPDALYARLVPPGLDPDPLGTVERLVAAQKAAEAAEESED